MPEHDVTEDSWLLQYEGSSQQSILGCHPPSVVLTGRWPQQRDINVRVSDGIKEWGGNTYRGLRTEEDSAVGRNPNDISWQLIYLRR